MTQTQDKKRFFGGSSDISIPYGTSGAMTEMIISVDLLKRGYAVFRALSPSCFCDLIAHKDGKLLKIECRTGMRNKGRGSLNFPRKVHGDIDIFAIFIPAWNEILYLHKDGTTNYEEI